MRIQMIIPFLLLPTLAVAQNYQGMSEQDMQKMMQQAQQMEACMQDIDQAKMRELEQRSYQLDAELKALCSSGKRSEAEAKALAFAQEMEQDTTVQKLKKCGELMQGMLPQMPFMDQPTKESGHVCDQ